MGNCSDCRGPDKTYEFAIDPNDTDDCKVIGKFEIALTEESDNSLLAAKKKALLTQRRRFFMEKNWPKYSAFVMSSPENKLHNFDTLTTETTCRSFN